jgi:predicted amidohydrolase YtcJ
MRIIRIAGLLTIITLLGCSEKPAESKLPAADRVFLNGVIYTADSQQRVVSALAVQGGTIAYLGDDAGARRYIGDNSLVVDLDGKMVLPGLHDMHIHPMGIIDTGGCDLNSEPLTLSEMATTVAACLAEQELAAGEWLAVDQWSFTSGNQADPELHSLRQALDKAAPDNPVILWGNDGHHGAVNSTALARGVNATGEVVGISAATLAEHFADYRATIGVDAQGQPNGELHETARELVRPPAWGIIAGAPAEAMPGIAAKLAQNGITAIQDAAAPPESLPLYRLLVESGDMSFHLSAALFQEVKDYTADDGHIDVAAMVRDLEVVREEYRDVPYIQAETAKIFVDGVIEGNPLNNPPTLPNAALLEPYKQPVFSIDQEAGTAEIVAYVDLAGEICKQARAAPDQYADPAAAAQFHQSHGFYPAQCLISRGVLENPRDFILDYMQALDKSGFNIHAHAIGDRAVRTALDGFDRARASNGAPAGRHSLAHIQLVAPEDYQRIGDLGLYLVFTYAWINPDIFYDLTVNPFIDELQGVDDLYNPESYYMQNVFPVGQLQKAGAILAAGSDAPVDTRDPRPFVNIQQAVTRSNEAGQVMNPAGIVNIRSALDAYTINGARMFGHDKITGSLELGKAADLVVIDRNLLALAETGRAGDIAGTQVLLTLFEGRAVYEAE